MMHMTFYWGTEVTLLFTSWKTHSWLGYSLTLLACLLASVFFQFLEFRRLKLRLSSAAQPRKSAGTTESVPLLQNSRGRASEWPARIGSAALFAVNTGLGYMLMLAVMSFNVGVFLAVVLGLTVGYAMFQGGDEELAVACGDNPCACA